MADNVKTVRDFIDCWNRRDWTRYRDMLHPQFSYTGGDGKRQDGPEAGLGVAQMYATAFPDGKIELQKVEAFGTNGVVAEFTGRGTHRGELMGVAPTGRSVSIPVCDVIELRDNKIYAEREYMDTLHMLTQLGVMSAPTTATR